MHDVDILKTLQTAVIAAVAAVPGLPDTAVKYIGLTWVPPQDQKYLEVVWIPNNRQGDFLADGKNYQGMLRLVLHWPIDQRGPYEPMRVLRDVCAYFVKGNAPDGVQFMNEPNMMTPIEEKTETLYPASIRYTSFRL